MPVQLITIHGGNFLSKGEDILTSLREQKITMQDLKPRQKKSWRENLGQTLGKNFEVLSPEMPNPQNAKYQEWKVWFEKIPPFLRGEVILLGHSLGGIFLAKYLAENIFPKKIRALLLVAAPYSEPKDKDEFASFTLPKDLSLIARRVNDGRIILYHSKDDSIVPFASLKKYQAKIPTAQARVFENRGHFRGATFPEIVEDLQALAR